MPHYRVTTIIEADSLDKAEGFAYKMVFDDSAKSANVERYYTDAEIDAYREECNENGEVACVDPAHHVWAVSDENDNYCYCEKCGCCEY
jgi:hypothetical protein